MSYGLEVRNEDGDIIFEAGNRPFNLIDSFSTTGSGSKSYTTHSSREITAIGLKNTGFGMGSITISGNTISWAGAELYIYVWSVIK